jgi:hypothetical protein
MSPTERRIHEQQEARIAWLEDELTRRGNVVSYLADECARLGVLVRSYRGHPA